MNYAIYTYQPGPAGEAYEVHVYTTLDGGPMDQASAEMHATNLQRQTPTLGFMVLPIENLEQE